MVAPHQEDSISPALPQSPPPTGVHAKVEARLSPLLGPFTCQTALKMLATEKLGRPPEEITREDLPVLFDALRPVLNTLVGKSKASVVIDDLKKELLGS